MNRGLLDSIIISMEIGSLNLKKESLMLSAKEKLKCSQNQKRSQCFPLVIVFRILKDGLYYTRVPLIGGCCSQEKPKALGLSLESSLLIVPYSKNWNQMLILFLTDHMMSPIDGEAIPFKEATASIILYWPNKESQMAITQMTTLLLTLLRLQPQPQHLRLQILQTTGAEMTPILCLCRSLNKTKVPHLQQMAMDLPLLSLS